MSVPVQIAFGVGLGYLVSRALPGREEVFVANRSRAKKKFVRVRSHMRCMPKKCKCEKVEPTIIERVVERPAESVSDRATRPESVKLDVQEKVALSANEIGEDEPTFPAIPSKAAEAATSNYDWPTMSDVVTRTEDESDFRIGTLPWRTIIIIGSVAGGLALLGSYFFQQQALQASEVTP